jgi:putative ABC transport system substrate-binding protein
MRWPGVSATHGRRAFLALAASALLSRAAWAQKPSVPARIGWLSEPRPDPFLDGFREMSYGANQRETYLRLAAYADRLLRGAKPGELPIEQATRFELVLNQRTARALGLSFSQAVMVSADRLVE